MIRVVLDANVFVSAVIRTDGHSAHILDAWREERFELVVSSAILEEIRRVLRYPRISRRHRLPEARIQELIDDLASLAVQAPGALTLDVIAANPADNRYLECAVEGEAEYLVTGDQRHLLPLGEYQGTKILTPRAFLEVL